MGQVAKLPAIAQAAMRLQQVSHWIQEPIHASIADRVATMANAVASNASQAPTHAESR